MSERFLGTGLSPEEAGQLADRLVADEASDAAILTACYGVTFPSEAERKRRRDVQLATQRTRRQGYAS